MDLKKSIKKIIKDIDEISVGGKTDVDKGLSRAIKQFTKANYKDVGNSKAILLVCDGDLEYNQEIVDKANKNDISIYTVLVGDKQDINLKKISENTGGSFFSVKNASDLSAAIFKMEKNIIGTVDTTDRDGDGIYDVYEEKGMLCSNGKIVRTDKNKMDSDRDGLSDYYEMTGFEYNLIPLIPIRKNIYLKKTDEYIEASCFSYRSNPNKMDTDGDEYDDKIDKRPLKRDVKLIGIKSNRNFVPIWKGKEGASWSESWDDEYVAYGGNQSWWEKQDEKFSESGCGIIAASNVLRYHQRKGENLIIPISKESYMQYTNRLKKHIYYLPFVGGTAGINIDHGIEKYCDLYHLNYASDVESSVFSEEKREKMQKRMIKEIKKKNPIILSVGPKVIGGVEEKYKVKMRKDNGSLITFGQLKKLYSHYVTVTGIIINEHNNTIKLQVSSWGDKYYVDLNDIYEYVDNYGDSYTCDVIFVDKK